MFWKITNIIWHLWSSNKLNATMKSNHDKNIWKTIAKKVVEQLTNKCHNTSHHIYF